MPSDGIPSPWPSYGACPTPICPNRAQRGFGSPPGGIPFPMPDGPLDPSYGICLGICDMGSSLGIYGDAHMPSASQWGPIRTHGIPIWGVHMGVFDGMHSMGYPHMGVHEGASFNGIYDMGYSYGIYPYPIPFDMSIRNHILGSSYPYLIPYILYAPFDMSMETYIS